MNDIKIYQLIIIYSRCHTFITDTDIVMQYGLFYFFLFGLLFFFFTLTLFSSIYLSYRYTLEWGTRAAPCTDMHFCPYPYSFKLIHIPNQLTALSIGIQVSAFETLNQYGQTYEVNQVEQTQLKIQMQNNYNYHSHYYVMYQ